jgi:hypothetical protein
VSGEQGTAVGDGPEMRSCLRHGRCTPPRRPENRTILLETYGRDSDRRFELHLALCLPQLTGASWPVTRPPLPPTLPCAAVPLGARQVHSVGKLRRQNYVA